MRNKKNYIFFLNGWLINYVLKTQFPSRGYVEKMPYQSDQTMEIEYLRLDL